MRTWASWTAKTALLAAGLAAATFALPGAGVAYTSGNGNITGNGNLSLLSGNTVNAPISAPVNLCGVSLTLLGFSNAGCAGGATSCIGGSRRSAASASAPAPLRSPGVAAMARPPTRLRSQGP
jgi:ChpA-C